jgi:PhoPQ-activated pathogenicity-related protein
LYLIKIVIPLHHQTKTAMNNASNELTQKVKSFLLNYAFSYGWNNASRRELDDEAQTIIDLVARGNYGFASEMLTQF